MCGWKDIFHQGEEVVRFWTWRGRDVMGSVSGGGLRYGRSIVGHGVMVVVLGDY